MGGGKGGEEKMKIQESAENYLEAILMLEGQPGGVRSIDVANMLGFSKPSVSFAMKRLREGGYVEMDENSLLSLTSSGREVAQKVYEKHELLTGWLTAIGVERQTARADACRIEHVLSEASFGKIREYVEKISGGAHGGTGGN